VDGANSTPETRRFEAALHTRQFEIDLFWKRSLFFWGFISAAFLAIGALKQELPTVSLLISGFGLVCSVSWTLVNRGSKYWQEQWESKIEKVEDKVTGPLFKTREPEQGKGLWGGSKYSVSKVTTAVSDYVSFVWFCIFVRQAWICLGFFQSDRYKLFCIFGLCVIPLVYVALLLGFGRTTSPQNSTDSKPLSENASDDKKVG